MIKYGVAVWWAKMEQLEGGSDQDAKWAAETGLLFHGRSQIHPNRGNGDYPKPVAIVCISTYKELLDPQHTG